MLYETLDVCPKKDDEICVSNLARSAQTVLSSGISASTFVKFSAKEGVQVMWLGMK